jgi:hypothetical protein
VGEVAREAGVCDRLADRAPVDFLRVVQFVAPGNTTGVIVPDQIAVRADRPDDIALHDLHVVDVVEQLDARRADSPDDGSAKGCSVALIVLVVHLAVEELHADRHAVVFRDPFHTIEPLDAVDGGFFVAHAAPVAEERDHVRHALGFGSRDEPFEVCHDGVVIGPDVQAVGDRAATGVPHRAHEPELTHHGPVGLLEQVDRRQADVRRGATEIRQRHGAVGPARHRLLDSAAFDHTLPDGGEGERRAERGEDITPRVGRHPARV